MRYELTKAQKINKNLMSAYEHLCRKHPDKFIVNVERVSNHLVIYRFYERTKLDRPVRGIKYNIQQLDSIDLVLENNFPWKWKF